MLQLSEIRDTVVLKYSRSLQIKRMESAGLPATSDKRKSSHGAIYYHASEVSVIPNVAGFDNLRTRFDRDGQ